MNHFLGYSWIRLQTAGQSHGEVKRRGVRVRTRRPLRGAQPVTGGAGNGGRTEVRQGAIRIFFADTFPASAPRDPPFRLHLMRDLANRPLARDLRTLPAFSRAQASQDRASGLRGVRLRCACGRPRRRGWGGGWRIGISRKTRMAPRSPRAVPVSLHVCRCGAHNPLLGVQGTVEGQKCGRGPSAFFSQTPFPPQRPATHHSGFTRCAIPRTVPSRETPRECPWPSRGAQASQDRASGVLGSRLRCACGRLWGRGWRDRYLPKKRGWPPAALPSLCRCRRVHTRVEQPPPADVP
jgi:hypothetical protein